MPARWMSRNRCQTSGGVSPEVCTIPRIAPMRAVTSLLEMPGPTAPAETARTVSSAVGLPDPAGGRGVRQALEEQIRVASVIGEGLPEGSEKFLEPVAVGSAERMLRGGDQLLEREPQQLVDECVLAGEPPVDGADSDAGACGDLLDACVSA